MAIIEVLLYILFHLKTDIKILAHEDLGRMKSRPGPEKKRKYSTICRIKKQGKRRETIKTMPVRPVLCLMNRNQPIPMQHSI